MEDDTVDNRGEERSPQSTSKYDESKEEDTKIKSVEVLRTKLVHSSTPSFLR
jgi:hypothetical protein